MERYTFDEIKNFKHGDIFWARNDKYMVNEESAHYSISDFYGDHSEKVEWTAVSLNTNAQAKFQVTNTKDAVHLSDPIIFKTPTSEPAIGIVDTVKATGN